MKKLLIVLAILFFLAVPAIAANVQLTATWDPSPTVATAFDSYRVYSCDTRGCTGELVAEVPSTQTTATFTMAFDEMQEKYFFVTAYAAGANPDESDRSNEAAYKYIPTPATPLPPGNMKVIVVTITIPQ